MLLYSEDAEKSLIGAILLDGNCLEEVIDILESEKYFYSPLNKTIYKSAISLFNNGEKIDFVKILSNICEETKMEEQELRSYLLDLVKIVPSISSAKAYAKIVKNKYNIRMIKELGEYATNETKSHDNSYKIIENLETKIRKLIDASVENNSVKLKNALILAIEEIDKVNETTDGIIGLKTGFKDLDKSISGLNKGELIIIAGRPGMGKTSLALNIAINISKSHKVLFLSLEMSKTQLALKAINSELGENAQKLNYEISSNKRLNKILDKLGGLELYIDDTASTTVTKIKATIQKSKGVEAVFIDHLQLINGSGSKQNRVQEVSEITRGLKILAKTLDIPIVCLSQLSRAPEARAEKKPGLADLRDSGSIEQDADVVLMLYREGYYDMSGKNEDNVCECIIAKNRHGETKSIEFNWDGGITKFSEKTQQFN